jgi:hypothetical protein
MNTGSKEAVGRSGRIWGWILTILGGVFSLGGIIGMFMVFYQVEYESYDPMTLMVCIIYVPGLIIGVPLLIIGIRHLLRTKELKK